MVEETMETISLAIAHYAKSFEKYRASHARVIKYQLEEKKDREEMLLAKREMLAEADELLTI